MTRKNAKAEVAPVDPMAAVGPLMTWWFQVVELIERIDSDCQRIEGQLGRTESPWRPFVDLERFREFAASISLLTNDALTSPFNVATTMIDPFAGFKGSEARPAEKGGGA